MVDFKQKLRIGNGKELRQHTFVFTPNEMMTTGNDTLDTFCEQHHVLSIIFSQVDGKLVYVILYKEG